MLSTPLQDASVFMEVDVGSWRALLDANGESTRLAGRVFTHQELMASLLIGDVHPEFYSVLEMIQELGTDDGRAHIEQLAGDQNLVLEVSSSDTPAREFVAEVLLRGVSEQRVKELLQVAHFTLKSVASPRTYREYVGKTSPAGAGLDASKLKAEIELWCREHQKSDVVTVHTHYVNDEWYCHVVRGDAVRRVMEVKGQAVSPLQYRPAATDLLRYDPKTGRIGIATRYGQMTQGYRAVMGKFLAGDGQFFAGENVCSLKALQEHRSALFAEDRLPRGILSVAVIDLLWRRGDRDKVWVKGRDCFRILGDLGAKLQEGEIVEARLSVAFASGGRHGLVTLKVPNIIDIKAGRNEALVERFLDSSGLRGSFKDDGSPRTFWGLFPWRLKEAEWRRRIGSLFDDLVGRKTLRAVTLSAITHPAHPSASSALEVVEVEGGAAIGVSEDQAIATRILTSSDTEAYELDASKLAQEIQHALVLQGTCRELDNGLWALGQRTFQAGSSIAVFLCLRAPAAATAAVMDVDAKGRGAAVLLYPECGYNPVASGIGVACRLPHGPYTDVVEKIVEQLGLDAVLPANLWSSADLILDPGRGLAWYLGVPLTGLGADTHAFKFAVALAKARGNVVLKQDLNALLSASRTDDEPAKKAKSSFLKSIEGSFLTNGRECPAGYKQLIAQKSGGYALQGTAKLVTSVEGAVPVT
jgi:hypothetical protein